MKAFICALVGCAVGAATIQFDLPDWLVVLILTGCMCCMFPLFDKLEGETK